jgi:hypothetical protein
MSGFRYHSEVLTLITQKGPLGVSEIAKALNVPATTLQKQLHSQDYFKLNNRKKWDLPENVAANNTNEAIKDFDKVIAGQLESTNALFGMLTSNINSIMTLLSAQKPIFAPVADNSTQLHPKVKELDKKIKETEVVFKKYVDKAPEMYQKLLRNLDLYALAIEKGTEYFNGTFTMEISSIFLEQTDQLSDEVFSLLEMYQKKD